MLSKPSRTGNIIISALEQPVRSSPPIAPSNRDNNFPHIRKGFNSLLKESRIVIARSDLCDEAISKHLICLTVRLLLYARKE